LQPTSEVPFAPSIHTPLAALPIPAFPLAVVPTKFPLRTLPQEWASISTPFPALPEIRLSSGGTTKTGGAVPLLPVGLFTWPVAVSTKAVPPIWLRVDLPVIHMPSPPLAIALVPAAFVPM
jgi:hypothetical protein